MGGERSGGPKAASMYMYGRPRNMYMLQYAIHDMEGSVHVLEVPSLSPTTTHNDDPHHILNSTRRRRRVGIQNPALTRESSAEKEGEKKRS